MKKTLLYVFLCLIVLLTGCGRVKRKLSGGSQPKAPPKDPFYTDTGFRDWYRFPLKYPYEVHMIDTCERGYLAVSESVKAPDSDSGNGAISGTLEEKITDLHLHEDYAFFRKEDWTYGYLQYSTGEVRLFETEAELKQTCLLGPDDFKPLEYYFKLFEKGTVMYPPADPSKPKEVRNHVIAHFNKLVVKMYPFGKDPGDPCIWVMYGEKDVEIDIRTGKSTWGELPPEAQDMIDQWLPLHRDELLEMWKARKLKELPPLTRSVLN